MSNENNNFLEGVDSKIILNSICIFSENIEIKKDNAHEHIMYEAIEKTLAQPVLSYVIACLCVLYDNTLEFYCVLWSNLN